MEMEISPEPSDAERRAIAAALEGAPEPDSPYASRWRAAALDDLRLGGDAAAQELGGDAGVVEP
jgi:hypothetical protein